jgi:RNA polymerase sigma factor (sigma-70 family)
MSISEEQQEAQRPTRLPRQPRREARSFVRAPSPSIAILPNRVGKSRKSSAGPPDTTCDRALAYAVCKPTHPSALASRYRKRDHRVVEEDVSDEMLLKGVTGGDKAAMHILFARHRTRVFRFIHRMIRNPGIADDIVSQVFLDIWRSANRFEGRARVSTWMLSIARFKAISFLQERTHESIDQDEVLGVADAGDTPDAALDRKETNGILRSCIDKLSPDHREIIDLFYYREKSVAEVSEIVGISACHREEPDILRAQATCESACERRFRCRANRTYRSVGIHRPGAGRQS